MGWEQVKEFFADDLTVFSINEWRWVFIVEGTIIVYLSSPRFTNDELLRQKTF